MKTALGTVLKFRTFHGTPNSPKDSKQQPPKVTENSKCPRSISLQNAQHINKETHFVKSHMMAFPVMYEILELQIHC
jgi:hypothetical protein